MILNYRKSGEGPALIILHGLYGSGTNWLNIASHFSKRFTVYLVEQRNHGDSPHESSNTYNNLSDDLNEFCNKLGLDSIFLIGHSMGGKAAMTFTLQHPGITKKLICVDISPYSIGQPHFSEQIQFHKSILETFHAAPIDQTNSRKDVEAFFAKTIQNKSIRKFLLKNLKRDQKGKFFWQLNVNALSANLSEIMDVIPPVKLGIQSYIPTLFIKGGKSPYITQEDIEAIPDVFQHASFVTFEEAGHWLHAEYPEKFISTAFNFFVD
jgi:esterase